MYTPTLASALAEFSVYGLFFLAAFDAQRRGLNWLATLIWGAAFGCGIEIGILLWNSNAATQVTYKYGNDLFWLNVGPHGASVPVWVGVGWGILVYISTWTADRLKLAPGWTALVAGVLAVSIDFSLEPVANDHGFWTWIIDPKTTISMLGVPFDNFVAWVGVVAIFGFTVRGAFRWIEHRFGKAARQKWYTNVVVPPVGAALAVGFYFLVDGPVNQFYRWVGKGGEPLLFTILFIGGMLTLWLAAFRSNRSEPVNVPILVTVFGYHAVSLVLYLLCSHKAELSPLLVMIPCNSMVGFFAFAWPSLDTLLGVSSRSDLQPGIAPMPDMPVITRKVLVSYGGVKVSTRFCAPATRCELRATLAYARRANWAVTFRAGESAFDTQSLNTDLVVSLTRFNHITVDAEKRTVTVGAGANWRSILTEVKKHGFVPYVMVTTGQATAGGTLSAHALSRFSPTCGREGQHVLKFSILTPDGRELECTRDNDNHDLFKATIGGLGYVGTVLDVTYKLLHLRAVPPDEIAVETVFTKIRGFEHIVAAMVENVERICGTRRVAVAIEDSQRDPLQNARGISVAMNSIGNAEGLLAVSSYVRSTTAALRRSVFHDPDSWGHRALQMAALVPPLRKLGYFLIYGLVFTLNKPKRYVDDLFGYTFFEDGNRQLRRCLRKYGIPAGIRQQTYVVPASAEDLQQSRNTLRAFMQRSWEIMNERGLEPTLTDILYLPDDAGENFCLSSSNHLPGFAVTFTFERVLSTDFSAEEDTLAAIADECHRFGGRVHLVKTVSARAELIENMYADGLNRLDQVRRRHNSERELVNDFARRVLPRLT